MDDLPRRNPVAALILPESRRTPVELRCALAALPAWAWGPGERELKRTFGGSIIECETGAGQLERAESAGRAGDGDGRA